MNQEKIEICKIRIVDQEKIDEVKKYIPADKDLTLLAETFKVLSDPTRLKIVLALSKGELCVCDLTSLFNVTVSAISHQLRLLKTMKIVSYRKQGKIVYYKLDDDHIHNLIQETWNYINE